MTELKTTKNQTSEFLHFRLLNSTLKQQELSPLLKIGKYFLILLLIFFIFIFVAILVLLIKRQIHKIMEKMRRIKLQNEINKIMMIDFFETKSPSIDSRSTDFHSVNNDSTLSDFSSSRNVLSEINVHNDNRNSKEENNN